MIKRFTKVLPRLTGLAKQNKAFFTTLGSKDLSKHNTVPQRETLHFGKENLTDFGDLPVGVIPDALRFDRPVENSVLSNGIRVATQHWPSELATVSVFIKCGSRQETVQNSGVAHFLEHLHFKGTKNRTRERLELDVENMGGQLNAYTSRENTSYTMTVFKKNTNKALEILGDMLCNSNYGRKELEAERETIYRECIETQKDQMETTIEAAHYTAYREHMMGQPILGIRENIGTITRDQIVEYHKTHYVGSKIVVVGAGEINHQELVELTEKYFGNLPKDISTGFELKNLEKPDFTPSLMFMRDDEMTNVNIGVFFEAPGWANEDYYSFLLYQRIIGEYNQGNHSGQNLPHASKQYNALHTLLEGLPDISLQKCIYAPYSDTGIFGSYFHGSDAHAFQMLYSSQIVAAEYANYLNEVELFRAKNKLYNELLQHETGNDMTQSIGNQILYLNRVVPRSEIATRIANIEQPHLLRVARNWFVDNEVAAVAWGPIQSLMTLSHYNKPPKRSTLGWQGDSLMYVD